MCATSSSAFEGSAIAVLFSRATSALRPGVKSRISALIPSFCKTAAMYIAASCSFPGGFVVLILMRSASQLCASFAIVEVSPIGGGFIGIPRGAAGETCAATGILAAIANAAAPTILWTMRFEFTNLSSWLRLPQHSRLSKRFALNVLHTNMQVWALGLGIGVALLKFNRFLATTSPRRQESSPVWNF